MKIGNLLLGAAALAAIAVARSEWSTPAPAPASAPQTTAPRQAAARPFTRAQETQTVAQAAAQASGEETTGYASLPATTSETLIVAAVSIYDSPAVPDLGGHSILGGLLTGKGLTAILPNLEVCARPKGTPEETRLCTQVCKPGHACLNQLFPGTGVILPNSDTPTLTVDVMDVDRPGSVHLEATDNVDIDNCESAQVAAKTEESCTMTVTDTATYGAGAAVTISFAQTTKPCSRDCTRANELTFTKVNGTTTTSSANAASYNAAINPGPYSEVVQVTSPVTISGTSATTGKAETLPNGILVTMHDPRAQFVQFLYREVIDSSGKPVTGSINCPVGESIGEAADNDCQEAKGHPGVLAKCKTTDRTNPHLCNELTTESNAPQWIVDGVQAPDALWSESWVAHDSCDNTVTLFDTPTFPFDSKNPTTDTWRFTAEDFILINGAAVWKVGWVLQGTNPPGGSQTISYTNRTIERADAADQAELRQRISDSTPTSIGSFVNYLGNAACSAAGSVSSLIPGCATSSASLSRPIPACIRRQRPPAQPQAQ
jgi:hypothetical protein